MISIYVRSAELSCLPKFQTTPDYGLKMFFFFGSASNKEERRGEENVTRGDAFRSCSNRSILENT